MFIPKWLEMRGNGPVRSFKKRPSWVITTHPDIAHPRPSPVRQLWKESLYSLLVKVQGCVPKVWWNNLRHLLMRLIFRAFKQECIPNLPCNFPSSFTKISKKNKNLPETHITPWKWMVGKRSFSFGMLSFEVRTVSFWEGRGFVVNPPRSLDNAHPPIRSL